VIRQVRVTNFRGIREGILRDFTPLVVLVGPNSSGKSTVLDAIVIGASSSIATAITSVIERKEPVLALKTQRSGAQLTSLSWKFRDGPIVIAVASEKVVHFVRIAPEVSSRRALTEAIQVSVSHAYEPLNKTPKLDPPPIPPGTSFSTPSGTKAELKIVSVDFVDPRKLDASTPLHILYTTAAERGLRNVAKSTLRELLPGLEDIEILAPSNQPSLHLAFSDFSLPANYAGDGVQLLLRLALVLTAPSGGIVLLEEPETHMHPGAVALVARVIHAAIARGVQVFLSTHSLELIDALTAGKTSEQLAVVSVYRLALDDGDLKSTRLDGAEVAFARASIEDDLR
jgi:predicted ATPase